MRIIRKFWLIKAGRTGNRAENRFRADWRGNRCAAFCGKRGDGDNAFRYGRGHACRRRICGLAVGRKSLARIQIEYLKKSGECLSGRKYRAAAGRNGGKTGVFPLCGRWPEAVEEEEISCVSGEGLAFAEASFDLSEFATVRLSLPSSKIAAFTELRWLRY